MLLLLDSEKFASAVASAVQASIKAIKEENERLKQQIIQHDKEITNLRTELQSQHQEIVALKEEKVKKERSEKFHQLRLTGLDCEDGDVFNKVKNLFEDKLGIDTINDNDISAKIVNPKRAKDNGNTSKTTRHAKRIAPSSNYATEAAVPEKRGRQHGSVVIVRFQNAWMRRKVFSAKRNLKGSGIFISEDLPSPSNGIFFKCRQLAKSGVILSTWTYEMNIFVKKKDNTIIQIKDDADIAKLDSNDE
ncbi:MAG: hypothetical protein AAF487_15060 [Bacteroidota bacterium]